MYSVILVPVLLFAGAVAFWYFTREVAALVMAVGFLPTFASVTQFWWGPTSYIEQNGQLVPDERYFEVAQTIGYFVSVGTTISAVAFIVLAWRLRVYVKPGT